MRLETQAQKGSVLLNNPVAQGVGKPWLSIPGSQNGNKTELLISNNILSRHSMFIGSTGCGKSNAIFQFVEQLKGRMNDNDVMLIFDTKGDYIKEFYFPQKC